jgi:hypothetical protein
MLEPYTKQENYTNLQLKRRTRRTVEEESGKVGKIWKEVGALA